MHGLPNNYFQELEFMSFKEGKSGISINSNAYAKDIWRIFINFAN